MIVLHLKTKHDSNGNPRRLYLPLRDHPTDICIRMVIVEGYGGTSKLTELFPNEPINLIPIEVPVSEYNDWIRHERDNGILIYQ